MSGADINFISEVPRFLQVWHAVSSSHNHQNNSLSEQLGFVIPAFPPKFLHGLHELDGGMWKPGHLGLQDNALMMSWDEMNGSLSMTSWAAVCHFNGWWACLLTEVFSHINWIYWWYSITGCSVGPLVYSFCFTFGYGSPKMRTTRFNRVMLGALLTAGVSLYWPLFTASPIMGHISQWWDIFLALTIFSTSSNLNTNGSERRQYITVTKNLTTLCESFSFLLGISPWGSRISVLPTVCHLAAGVVQVLITEVYSVSFAAALGYTSSFAVAHLWHYSKGFKPGTSNHSYTWMVWHLGHLFAYRQLLCTHVFGIVKEFLVI